MDHLLSCECGAEHRVLRSQAGQEIQCDCGRILSVPTLRGLAQLPVAPADSHNLPKSSIRGATASSAWQGWRGTTLSLVMAGCLLACLACGWFSWQSYRVATSYTVAEELESGKAMIEHFDPSTLEAAWYNFNRMGLRTKQYPYFYVANVFAEEQARNAKIAGSIALGFAAIAVALWITTKKKAISPS